MNTRKILLTVLLALVTGQGFCFDDMKTHPDLTKQAILTSSLPSYLVNYLGLPKGIDTNIYGPSISNLFQYKKITQWLQAGSDDEDASLGSCRASNHFHNPIHAGDWTQSKMSDSWMVDRRCGTSNRYSDVTWATGYTYPPPDGGKITRNGQLYGWDNARQYYYKALTTTDTYTNSSGTSKDNLFVLTFRSLGMVMHLLQDMAVPAHVRNDMTSHLTDEHGDFGHNAFEKYVKIYDRAIMNTPVIPSVSMYTKLTDFWDANVYNGVEPEISKAPSIGLAEYTNANFVSDFTIFNQNPTASHYFPYPAESSVSTGDRNIANPFVPGQTVARSYFVKTSDGAVGYLLAGVDYLTVVTAPNPPYVGIIPIMDDYVHSDYAQLLLPRAGGYSAALLDYFFRGVIELKPVDGGITANSIKLTAKNVTANNEAMSGGTIELVLRYRNIPEVKALKAVSFPEQYKVIKLPGNNLTIGLAPQEFTFTLSEPLPDWANDVTAQLVYHGQLGNEAGAVAVGFVPLKVAPQGIKMAPPASSGAYASAPATGGNGFTGFTFNVSTDRDLAGGVFELMLIHRSANGDQFQGVDTGTNPTDPKIYRVIRARDNSSVSGLASGASRELSFNLTLTPVPLNATDIHIYLMFKKNAADADATALAVGYLDISEPTPIDIFNNTDKVCLNGKWYDAGSKDAMTIADTNGDGYADLTDIFRHRISNIFYRPGAGGPASSSNYLFASKLPLEPGSGRRLGYILTDYYYIHSFTTGTVTSLDNRDTWTLAYDNSATPAEGFANQHNLGTMQGYSGMYDMRGYKMHGGAGVVFDNKWYPDDSKCSWDLLRMPSAP